MGRFIFFGTEILTGDGSGLSLQKAKLPPTHSPPSQSGWSVSFTGHRGYPLPLTRRTLLCPVSSGCIRVGGRPARAHVCAGQQDPWLRGFLLKSH
jgi:hypothetical protein